MTRDTCIRPGKLWRDTNGRPIQAHGFTVFYDDRKRRYYWFGENKEFTKKGGTVWHYGVRYYESEDLYHWTDLGLLIPPAPDDFDSPLHPTYHMDRPHIIYCERTGNYVAWLKIMGEGDTQFMTVMQARRFTGPYEIVRKVYHPLDMNTGDFTLHVDEETKKAYIFFERPHFELVCATLDDDYTGVTGEYSEHYRNLFPPHTREAPVFFSHKGKKYLFTSGTSGYFPNQSTVCVFEDYHGEYRDLGDPCIGDSSHTTFNSQISCVLKLPGRDQLIACADRWKPNPLIPKLSGVIRSGMEKHFEGYEPDRSPKRDTKLVGKLMKNEEATCKSRYVWLPIEWEGEKPVLRWRAEWRL